LLIRDAFENDLKNQGVPEYLELGGRELPIIVQDKVFVGTDIGQVDPTWSGPDAPGSLWYGHEYDTAIFGRLSPTPAGPPPAVSVVPEFFGDTMLANGTVYPRTTVEARRYRLRILNACNARFLNLQMYVANGSPNGITLGNAGIPLNAAARNGAAANKQGKPTSNFLVLGTEGGFLPTPAIVPNGVPFNGTAAGGSLLLAPAERVDVLFDFSAHAGQRAGPAPRDEHARGGRLRPRLHGWVDGKCPGGGHGGLADRQPLGGHASDPLPPGECAGDFATGVRRLRNGVPNLQGAPLPPPPFERGWK
jgi:spore coat protein A, manganese oxidase